MESKILKFHKDKSNFMVIGNAKAKKEIRSELEANPRILCGKPMQEVNIIKYLGDYLSVSLEDSVYQTVLKRAGIVKQSIYEIRAIIEDRRANQIGGINLAFEMWDAAVIPMLFFNSESWTNMSRKTFKVINSLFNSFYRVIFRIGTGCPIPNFYWQCGTMKAEFYILQRKLNFLFHLANLSLDSLARNIFDLQEKNSDSVPSLFSECRHHLTQLNFQVNRHASKWQWKKLVRRYIEDLNRKSLLDDIKKYKKLDYNDCASEQFKRKQYFFEMNICDVRDRFRISSKMFGSIKGNFPQKYGRDSLECVSCKHLNNSVKLDTQSHLIEFCPAFSDLRDKHDTKTDRGITEFFREVVKRRIEDEEV